MSAAEEQSVAVARLRAERAEAVIATHAHRGDVTVEVDAAALHDVCRFLRDAPELAFDQLLDVTAVDYLGSVPRFEVVYHLRSLGHGHRLRVKARVPEDAPQIASVTDIWVGADWLERETWDLYGIRFEGHPDLRRIYLYEEFQGHPLRKDYPKEKRQPLVGRDDVDGGQAERLDERTRERYGRWQ